MLADPGPTQSSIDCRSQRACERHKSTRKGRSQKAKADIRIVLRASPVEPVENGQFSELFEILRYNSEIR